MTARPPALIFILLLVAAPAHAEPLRLRVATWNLQDVRAEHADDPDHPRLQRIAAVLQAIRPDVLLINEIQHDAPDGRTARRFADVFLAAPQTAGAEPLRMQVFAAPSNTGVHSGFDLDRNGVLDNLGSGRDYAGDCWGYGEFPGQYAMALLVREGLEIDADAVRTFRTLPWASMPDALLPTVPDTGEPWFEPEASRSFPLSSKSHWDIPVRLPGGATIHMLCSHPTPPVFDGPEDRNGKRNHDEIRFWAEYIGGGAWIVDDAGGAGGLAPAASFVIVGDLNADPLRGDSRDNPVGRWLLSHPRLAPDPAPRSDVAIQRIDDVATARFGLRVDYALPSAGLRVVGAGMEREIGDASDHFPVWVDIEIDAP